VDHHQARGGGEPGARLSMAAAADSGKRAASTQTIAAIATAAAPGAIGIVRLSGPRSLAIGRALTGKKLKNRFVHFAAFRDAYGAAIDRGLALAFRAPHSYTGEDVLELHAHGSPIVLDLLLRRVLELGARAARPGEFTERAFHNGKLDLAQAEAVADLIASGSAHAARAAQRSLDGAFSREVHALLQRLVRLRAWLEAALDFPEEEIDFLSAPQLGADFDSLRRELAALLAAGERGAVLRDGVHAVIVGRPNVGKSSVLNALSRSERAIVTPIPGTTRDLLRESIDVDGVLVTLVDTAGLRDSDDIVEREGMQRARNELARADLAVIVSDPAQGDSAAELASACHDGSARLFVHNKIDASGEAARIERRGERESHVYVSALRGDGIVELRAEIRRLAGAGDGAQGTFSARRRHVDALLRVARHLDEGLAALREHRAGELAAEELRLAQQAFGEITGDYTSDDLLGEIFSSFCIGK
jgi:tRNA modification GTPase